MVLLESELTASQVLRVFHRDEIFLFLGSAFTTIGLVIGAFLVIRRRFDALLFWLALFAILYGQRLWMRSDLLAMLIPPSEFFVRLKTTVDFLVAIPAFLFFQATGFLGKLGRIITFIACLILFCIMTAAIAGAPLRPLQKLNNLIVICALLVLVVESIRRPIHNKDFIVARNGLLIFAAFALWHNLGGVLGYKSEPYGFGIFLGCLGYVAARRTIERDQQFSAIQKELDVAKRIQLSILPATFPASPHFQVAARYVPMTSVAGDFYDFLLAQDGKAGLLIADVSGHGVPAALIASMVKIAATSQREHAAHPAKLLAGMNDTLCGHTQSQFVTTAYVHLDAYKEELHYAAAGHPPMLLLREGKVTSVEENGMMLAVFPAAVYTSTTRCLKSGDRLLLYTDGIFEAANATEEQFGHERLVAVLQESAGLTAEQAADLILSRVQKWSASQDDDLTVIVCDYSGNASA
jgi:phosphoserine phosphatase RsbU/P